jgi:hypothetical protein
LPKRELGRALLNVEHGIGSLPFREDFLALAVYNQFPAAIDFFQKRL